MVGGNNLVVVCCGGRVYVMGGGEVGSGGEMGGNTVVGGCHMVGSYRGVGGCGVMHVASTQLRTCPADQSSFLRAGDGRRRGRGRGTKRD